MVKRCSFNTAVWSLRVCCVAGAHMSGQRMAILPAASHDYSLPQHHTTRVLPAGLVCQLTLIGLLWLGQPAEAERPACRGYVHALWWSRPSSDACQCPGCSRHFQLRHSSGQNGQYRLSLAARGISILRIRSV